MRVVQRTLFIVVMVLFIMKGWHFVCTEKEEKLLGQWEQLHTELFLQNISRKGILFPEDYEQYSMALNSFGTGVVVCLEEYQKETDKEGNVYSYLITWDELKEDLLYKEQVIFANESVIRLEIFYSGKNKKNTGSYFIKLK